MSRRSAALSRWAAVFLLATCASSAQAHRILAEYRLLPGGMVQIEAWYDVSRVSPKGAEVQVFGSGEQPLVTGRLDGDGRFVFPVTKAEPLRVVIAAGAGHRKELHIPAEALAPGAPTTSPAEGDAPAESVPRADRSSQASWRDVILGVGFLLALAAFVLGVRNARYIRKMKSFSGEP